MMVVETAVASALTGSGGMILANSLLNWFTGKSQSKMMDIHHEEKMNIDNQRLSLQKKECKLHKAHLSIAKKRMEFDEKQRLQHFIDKQHDREHQAKVVEMQHYHRILEKLHSISVSYQAWMNPYTSGKSESPEAINPLQVFFIPPYAFNAGGLQETFPNTIESEINKAILQYKNRSNGRPIKLHMGGWRADASISSGNALATEMHNISRNTPTLILRMGKTYNNELEIYVDMLGFNLGGVSTDITENMLIETIACDIETPEGVKDTAIKASKALGMLTQVLSDVYFLSTYGMIPMMPSLLSQHDSVDDRFKQSMMNFYCTAIYLISTERPELWLPMMRHMAEHLYEQPEWLHIQYHNMMQQFLHYKQVISLRSNELPKKINTSDKELILLLYDMANILKLVGDSAILETIKKPAIRHYPDLEELQ